MNKFHAAIPFIVFVLLVQPRQFWLVLSSEIIPNEWTKQTIKKRRKIFL
jgi:hypothetical protein